MTMIETVVTLLAEDGVVELARISRSQEGDINVTCNCDTEAMHALLNNLQEQIEFIKQQL